MFYPIVRSQYNDNVLSTKAIIETHVADNAIRIIPRGLLKILQ